MTGRKLFRGATSRGILGWLLAALPATAQIVGDGTLGTQVNGAAIAPCTGTCIITNGATRGTNLFHSFQQFSLPNGDFAGFVTTPAIQNVIVRVTGVGQPFISNINGTIATSNPANFFLLNPNGIVFGPGATLNIGGSFLATTAERMLFQDGTQFSTTDPAPLLTISVPIGLQFGSAPGNIQMQGSFLSAGNPDSFSDFALVGGDVTLDNSIIRAPGQRVELGGVGTNGTVGLVTNGNQLKLSFVDGVARSDVVLTNLDPIPINLSQIGVAGTAGGDIAIHARNLTISNGSSLVAGIYIGSQSPGAQAGDITLNATGAITVDSSRISNSVGAIFDFFIGDPLTIGNAGSINITAGSLTLQGGNLTAGNAGLGNGGNINVRSGSLTLFDSTVNTNTNDRGNAGDISFQVDGATSIIGSRIDSQAFYGTTGNAGNIQIQTGSLSMTPFGQSYITTATSGNGNAGNVVIRATNAFSMENGFISSNLNFNAIGKGGDITIEAGSVSLEGAFINNNTFGTGDSGNITVRARETISLANGSSLSSGVEGLASGQFQDAIGNGGTIRVEAQSLDLTQGSQLKTSTAGQGKAGDIQVITANSVLIDGTDQFGTTSGLLTSSLSSATGAGGQVRVETGLLRVTGAAEINASTSSRFEGGQISVNASNLEIASNGRLLTTTSGFGQAGNITINAPNLQLEGPASGVFAQTTSQGAAGNLTLQPNIGGNLLSIRVQDGAQISASSLSSGQGGSILVTAPRSIMLGGNGALSAGTRGSGAGGSLQLSTQQLSIQDSINLTASTFGSGKAGNIAINADMFTLSRSATVSTSTFSSGQAGNLTVQVSDRLALSGTDTGLFANTAPGSSGNGGNIFIDPRTVTIQDGARIAVDSQGSGQGGNIQIQAGTLTLANQGVISAQTASNQGGNIALNVQDLLLLRRGSQISTTAGTAQGGGDGGNINLNSQFIVAVLAENSDITANAFTGNGGRVDVRAQSIFGLQFQPQLTPFSDITASSQFGINGTVTLNTLDVDPSRGLVALPGAIVDVSNQIAQGCNTGSGDSAGQFAITGRGGLPANPEQPLSGEAVWEDTRLAPAAGAPIRTGAQRQPQTADRNPATPIVPAVGWVFNGNGEVTLVAAAQAADPLRSLPSNCRVR